MSTINRKAASPFGFLRDRAANPASRGIIARSETTKQSPLVKRRRLLSPFFNGASHDKFDRNLQPHVTEGVRHVLALMATFGRERYPESFPRFIRK